MKVKSKNEKKLKPVSKNKNSLETKSASKSEKPSLHESAPEAPTHLTVQDICLLVEITQARVSQLKKEGILKTDSTGEFPFIKTVKAIIMYYKNMNTGSAVNRYKAAKADLAEMKAKEQKKLLLRREAVEFGLTKVVSIVTEQLNDMPEALASLISPKEADTVAETIRGYAAKILENMRKNIESEFC